jgi:hypothetical protein
MTTQIGLSGSEATVPDPVYDGPYEEMSTMIGASARMLDGTRKRHITARKRTWRVVWEGLTDSALTTLTAELNRKSDLSWQPPNGGTYVVQADGYIVEAFTHNTWRVTVTLEEV